MSETIRKLRVVSLFTGAGGFDFGFEQAGFEIIGQCDLYDPAAIPSLMEAHEAEMAEADDKKRKSIKKKWAELCHYGGELADYAARHWPDVKRINGVQDVKAKTFTNVDVLFGGFPCQGLSVAGRRRGLADQRSGLWFEFLRAITEIKPRWVVIENVPGLLSSNEKRDFATLLWGLRECGYLGSYRTLNSQFWGVPQRRRRVFIVGHLGAVCGLEILFERGGGDRNYPACGETGAKDTGVSEGGVGMGDRELVASIRTAQTGSNGWGIKTDGKTGTVDSTGCGVVGTPTARMGKNGGAANDSIEKLVVGPITATSMGTQGGYNNQAEAGHAIPVVAAHETGQSHWNESEIGGTIRPNGSRPTNIIAATLRSGGDGGFPSSRGEIGAGMSPGLHAGVRRLTPLECELLQGFPGNATAGHSDTTRYKMMGNAVTVTVARWIAGRLLRADRRREVTR